MPALNDGTCPKCSKRFGWSGELKDCPPCPRCGYQIDPASWEAAEKEMEEARKTLLERKRKRGNSDPRSS